MSVARLSRRQLLLGVGGSVAIAGSGGLWLVSGRWRNRLYRQRVDRGDAFAPSVYLAIEPSGDIRIWLNRAEMGQGVITSLPLVVAEELDADWSRVKVEQAIAHADYNYGSLATAASASLRSQWTDLRRAGATARAMLLEAAAKQWNVLERECLTRDGLVIHSPSDRRLGYGELADAAAQLTPPLRPRLKKPEEFRLIGTDQPRTEEHSKVTGSTTFGLDVRLPGMRYAVVARPPSPGARVLRFDDTLATAIPGVREIVQISTGLVVVADNTYAAIQGREALEVEWSTALPGRSDIDVRAELGRALESINLISDAPDQSAEIASDSSSLAADYYLPFAAHAALEPTNCVVRVSESDCEIWAPTQSADAARFTAASVAGVLPSSTTVHTTLLGGGFGRRASSDFIAEATEVATRVDGPVQVVWTREDDMRYSPHRGSSAQQLEATMGADGSVAGWRHRIATAGLSGAGLAADSEAARMGADDLPYKVRDKRIDWIGIEAPVPTTIWRSVGHAHTAFAIESFIDELADFSGEDPLDFRLSRLPASPRLRHCIERVAEKSNWQTRLSDNRFLGLAALSGFGSHIAQIVELSRQKDGALEVERLWCVADCGLIVQPGIVSGQIEGGSVFALSAALAESISLHDSVVTQSNFDTYPLIRMDGTPAISVELVQSSAAPGGVGELGVPAVAPAIANAIYAATGNRQRSLPLNLA